jgi:hypothetical protein
MHVRNNKQHLSATINNNLQLGVFAGPLLGLSEFQIAIHRSVGFSRDVGESQRNYDPQDMSVTDEKMVQRPTIVGRDVEKTGLGI